MILYAIIGMGLGTLAYFIEEYLKTKSDTHTTGCIPTAKDTEKKTKNNVR